MRRLRLGFALALVLLAVLVPAGIASGRYVRLTILHTNDTHSHLLPFSYPSVVKDENGNVVDLPAYKNVGGIARRATLINRIRSECKENVLLMDAGDVIDGSPFSIEFAGEADFAALNAAGYEVITTGNHEYSNTLIDFQKRLSQASFPVLGANVFRPDGTPLLTPYVVKTEDGLRVAILGLVIPNNYTAAAQGELKMKDPIQVAKEWVPKLRNEADVVVVLSHIGFDTDKKLAAQVPGIDVIIGGHSHTRVGKPVLVQTDKGPHAFWVGGTVVAQDFQWGSELGRVDLIFRKGLEPLTVEARSPREIWTLMSYKGGPIPVTSDIPEDPAVRQVVESYHQKIAPKYDVVVGAATADLLGEAAYNLVSDALRESFKADFAVHNYGGVRTDLVQGPLTYGDIAMMLPFTNAVLTFKATGAELKQILLQRPAVSNIKYRVEKGGLTSAEIGGQPIDDTKTYTGVTHSFFASNSMPKEIATTQVAPSCREVVVDYVKNKKTLSPDNEKRAIF